MALDTEKLWGYTSIANRHNIDLGPETNANILIDDGIDGDEYAYLQLYGPALPDSNKNSGLRMLAFTRDSWKEFQPSLVGNEVDVSQLHNPFMTCDELLRFESMSLKRIYRRIQRGPEGACLKKGLLGGLKVMIPEVEGRHGRVETCLPYKGQLHDVMEIIHQWDDHRRRYSLEQRANNILDETG